jgi:hypothetical protein
MRKRNGWRSKDLFRQSFGEILKKRNDKKDFFRRNFAKNSQTKRNKTVLKPSVNRGGRPTNSFLIVYPVNELTHAALAWTISMDVYI